MRAQQSDPTGGDRQAGKSEPPRTRTTVHKTTSDRFVSSGALQRNAEQLVYAAIQMSDTGKTALSDALQDPETRKFLQARLRQTRKRLRSLSDTVSKLSVSSFGGAVAPKDKHYDPTSNLDSKFPSAATVKRRRSHTVGPALEPKQLSLMPSSRRDRRYMQTSLALADTVVVGSPSNKHTPRHGTSPREQTKPRSGQPKRATRPPQTSEAIDNGASEKNGRLGQRQNDSISILKPGVGNVVEPNSPRLSFADK